MAEDKPGIRLTSLKKRRVFLVPTLSEATRWCDLLKRRCQVVMLHISRDYAMGTLVGKGNHAKVHVATQRTTNNSFAMKSLNKNNLRGNEKNLAR